MKIEDFELMINKAKANTLSKISGERELTDKELKQMKEYISQMTGE